MSAVPPPHREPSREDAPARLWPVRVGLALVIAVYLVYSSFGFAHPVLWGHYGHHTAEYLQRAKTSLRFHLVTPATSAGYEAPQKQFFYFHHPIGYHHIYTLLIGLFGDHHWLGAVVPAATGLLTLWALFALVRRFWGRPWALLAAAVWVGLPIICSFSILTDAMLPAMACSILMVHSYLAYRAAPPAPAAGLLELDEPAPGERRGRQGRSGRSGRRTWLLRACLATVLGGLLMWEAYFQAAFHGLHALASLATRRGRSARLFGQEGALFPWGRARGLPAPLVWLAVTGAAAALTMAFHFGFVWLTGMWADFTASYHQRRNAAWPWVIERHEEWLRILYGKPLVALGALWLLVFLGRAVAGRARGRDQAVLIFFVINVFYIYLFPEASSVHLYRVFWFSSFFTLAVTDLASDLYHSLRHLLRARPTLARRVAGGALALAITAYFAVDAPHALHNLVESREVMGTHGLPGYTADYPKLLFAAEVARRTGPDDFVWVHDNLSRRIEFYYYVDRTNGTLSSLSQLPFLLKQRPRSVVVMDAYPPAAERKLVYDLLKHHPGYLFDRYLFIDLRKEGADFHEYVFEPRRPPWTWSWFVSHRYPPMRLKEVTTLYGACAYAAAGVKPPAGGKEVAEPALSKVDLAQCYHNYEVLRGHAAVAEDFRRRVVASATARDVPLGDVGRVIGLAAPARGGVGVWLLLEQPPPPRLWFRWRLTRMGGAAPGQRTLAGEAPPNNDWLLPEEAQPGYLYHQRIDWTVPAGRYWLTLELAAPPSPVTALPPTPPPHKQAARPLLRDQAAAPPPPLARADLGFLDIR